MKVICTRCGGTNIACGAIVNPNTGKIIDYLDESFMHANCGDCEEEVVITDVDRVKKDIDSMFFKFVKKNGKEPEYVELYKASGDKMYFKYMLFNLGIVDRWKRESDELIAELEDLRGKKWVNPYTPEKERFTLTLTDEERYLLKRALKPGIIPQKISKNVGKRLIRQR